MPPSLFHPALAPPRLESGHRQILITWQSHSRRLQRFPLRPRPAPQTALLLPHRPNFTLGAKKKKPPTSQQIFVKPRELCPLSPAPGRDRMCQEWEMPAPSMPLAALSPFNTSDHSTLKKPLSSWRFKGGFLHLHREVEFQLRCNVCYCNAARVSHTTGSKFLPLLPLQRGFSPALLLGRAVSALKLLAWLKALEKCSSTTEPMSPWK